MTNKTRERIKELIAYFLGTEAKGRENATPRTELKHFLADAGYPLADRTMRRIYSTMPFVGYAIDGEKRGLYWIMTKEEAFECERLRKSQGRSCIIHGTETAKSLLSRGQMELPL